MSIEIKMKILCPLFLQQLFICGSHAQDDALTDLGFQAQ